MTPVSNPFPLFTDTRSQIAEGASIYIGQPEQDPESNPKQVFWDVALTIPAQQPLRTIAGYIYNGGSPATPYVDGAYSIRVRQANGAIVYYNPSVLDGIAAVTARLSELSDDLANSDGASLVGFKASGVSAVDRNALEKLRENVSVKDYGAKLDGVTDDLAACQAASAAARNILIPPGRLFLSRPWDVESGRRIYGAGKSAWEPYTGTDKPAIYLTEIVVDGTDAFDCRGTNSVTIEGLGICSKRGTQSAYRAAPGFQAKSGGIAITGSSQFQARDVSFFGLEYGIHSHLNTATIPGGGTASGVETSESSNSANATQMPSISDWQASDCKRVFQFGNADSSAYTARDVRISNEVVALHCDTIVEAHWCDGVRMENLRLYQCVSNSVFMRRCVFVTFAAVTVFETGQDAVVLQECENVDGSGGLTTGRTGFYAAPVGSPGTYTQRRALVLDRCLTVKISGIIEKPTGKSVDVIQCSTVNLDLACDTPFWLTGNASNTSGAINVAGSTATTINASFGGAGHQVNVFADPVSARTLVGNVIGNPATGVTRAVKLQQQGGYTHRLATSTDVINNGVWVFDTLRMLLPAGKKLKTRSVELTTTGVFLRANGLTWSAETLAEPGGGSIAFDDKVLAENTGSTDVYVSVPLALVNLSGATITVPVGHEARISTVIV